MNIAMHPTECGAASWVSTPQVGLGETSTSMFLYADHGWHTEKVEEIDDIELVLVGFTVYTKVFDSKQ